MAFHFLLGAFAALPALASAADVVAHYMAQTLVEDHAWQDVNDALSLGISAFALNVGEPDADWCKSAVQQLFDAAAETDFKIFFSLDLYAESDPYAFTSLINQYASHPSYYTSGPDGAPFLSTFLDAGWGADSWASFLDSLEIKPYFVPNFDQNEGYYTEPDLFWEAWNSTLDGAFSWEQAWPGRSDGHLNVTSDIDLEVMASTHDHAKSYMIGLSSLQYKHLWGQHWFRAGDVVLPQRMAQILSMQPKPDYVQIQTWNDAGEAHYIGKLWKEGLIPDQLLYANQEEFPHVGWQPLVASFISAFRSGADATGMRPQGGSSVVGAMWHHEFLTKTAECAGDELGRPEGYGASLDTVNWAVVIGEDLVGYSVQVWSGGEMIAKDVLTAGLNYKAVPNVKVGEQVVQVVDADGNVIAEGGKSTKGIAQDAPGLCNYNFQVAGIIASSPPPPATSTQEPTSTESGFSTVTSSAATVSTTTSSQTTSDASTSAVASSSVSTVVSSSSAVPSPATSTATLTPTPTPTPAVTPTVSDTSVSTEQASTSTRRWHWGGRPHRHRHDGHH